MNKTPIIDTHLHLWDPNAIHYPWLKDVPSINAPHLIPDYKKATQGIEIEKMVFLQCEAEPSQYLDEVKWVSDIAQTQDSRIQSITAWAPLEKGDAAQEDIDKLKDYPLVNGIRRIIQFEDDDEFCLQPDFIKGVQLMEKCGWNFEICIKGDQQFENVLSLVRQTPNVPFILNHIGKPFIADGILSPWDEYIAQLASLPNTTSKVSGLMNEAGEDWSYEDLRPYLDTVFEQFTIDRVFFGGDWPVCTLNGTYARWYETITRYLDDFSDTEQVLFFNANARRIYHL
ncbi:MAG: amidohydrolase [Puniceicoccaceae bacterium]